MSKNPFARSYRDLIVSACGSMEDFFSRTFEHQTPTSEPQTLNTER